MRFQKFFIDKLRTRRLARAWCPGWSWIAKGELKILGLSWWPGSRGLYPGVMGNQACYGQYNYYADNDQNNIKNSAKYTSWNPGVNGIESQGNYTNYNYKSQQGHSAKVGHKKGPAFLPGLNGY